MKTYQQFIEKVQWRRASNYSGPDYSGYLVGPSVGRDSDILTQSNFEAALERLGGESESVEVVQFSCWAGGWFKSILIDKNDDIACRALFGIHLDLESYPVLDEDDFYERENESLIEITEQCLEDFMKDAGLAEDHKALAYSVLRSHIQDMAGYHGAEDAWYSPEMFMASVFDFGGNQSNEDLEQFFGLIKVGA